MTYRFRLSHVLHNLLRRPLFSLVVILTLGVAIGANTAIFSLVDAVLIRPLPYPDSERLVGVWHTAPAIDVPQFQQADGTYLIYRDKNTVFEEMGVYRTGSVNLAGDRAPEEVDAAFVTPSLLFTLKVNPAIGRAFVESEERPGEEPAALLSHGLWTVRYGADPGIIGEQVRVDGIARTIVGVMPAGFHFPSPETRLWLPQVIDPAKADTGNFLYTAVARLRPGVEPSTAAGEISALVKVLPEEAANPHMSAEMIEQIQLAGLVLPLRDEMVGDVSIALQVLLGSVGVILLIACANVANLFLVRAEGRYKEFAIRSALGASRREIALTILAESTVLALAGGIVGLGLAGAAIRILGSQEAHQIPRLEEVALNGTSVLFMLGVALLSGLLAGAIPAMRGIASLATALKECGGLTPGRARHHARKVLVVAQIALALILLTCSGLMVQSLRELLRVDPGLNPAGVLTMRLTPPAADYGGAREIVALSKDVLDRVRALPGVASAGIVNLLPLADQANVNTHVFEDFPVEPGTMPPFHPNRLISPGYFEAMGIPLRAGRAFDRSDLEQPSGALVVSAALARHYWPGESAIGKRLRPETTRPGTWHTVVGVVGDTRDDLAGDPTQAVYYPLLSRAETDGREIHAIRSLNLVIRSGLRPTSMADSVREAVHSVDPDVSVARVTSMDAIVAQSGAQTAFTTLMLVCAAGMAVGLGTVGLSAAVSYVVSQRTREIGVRMVLGADRFHVTWMVLRQALGLSLAGIAVGVGAAYGLTRKMESLLFGVSPTDARIFGTVALAVVVIALLASYLPARRAARVSPLTALHEE